jgi:hypothetical protein
LSFPRVRVLAGLPATRPPGFSPHATRVPFLVLSELPHRPAQLRVQDVEDPARLWDLPLHPAPAGPLVAELERQGLCAATAAVTDLDAGGRYAAYEPVPGPGAGISMVGRTEFVVPPPALPPGGLSVALASCFYKDFHQASAYARALEMAVFTRPVAKFLLGDNLYLDTARSERGIDTAWVETAFRYRGYWFEDPYSHVLGTLPTLFAFDDHELWNNYPEEVCWLSRSRGNQREAYEKAGLAALDLFQASLNPPPVVAGSRSFRTTWAGLPLFFLDLRTQRTRHDRAHPSLAPGPVFDALETWAGEPGPRVLALSQPVLLDPGGSTDWNPAAFAADFDRLLGILEGARSDVLILSGDVHHSRVAVFAVGGRSFVEIVASPASHIPAPSSVASGSFATQGRSAVSVPGSVTGRLWRAARVEVLMGSSVANTVAHLHFAPVGDSVAVSVAFLDLAASPVAPAAAEVGTSASCRRESIVRLHP